VTTVDWVALGFVGLAALMGWRKGLIAGALSLAGVAAGAVLGARVAPHLLSGGEQSPYTPLVALAGAFLLASVLEGALGMVGSAIRKTMRIPPLRALDSAGGFLLGAAAGAAIVWVVGAAALQLPGQTTLRHGAQESTVLRELNALVPPRDVLKMLSRVDPFPTIAGPEAPTEDGDPALLRSPGVRRAAPSVVRVLGTACGLSVAGSGWVAKDGVVVTAAHVVAGQDDTHVVAGSGGGSLEATAIAYDTRNDIAVLRVPGLRARPLRLADPTAGTPVAILGYPENGPFTARAGRLGRTTRVVNRDSYGKGPTLRTMTAIRGDIRHGNSGGPTVDGSGAVVATVFAAKVGGGAGYAVPTAVVRQALAGAKREVGTGDCTG
jgi:S1-C subfamily serine protease